MISNKSMMPQMGVKQSAWLNNSTCSVIYTEHDSKIGFGQPQEFSH
jgi:hypothetical protein